MTETTAARSPEAMVAAEVSSRFQSVRPTTLIINLLPCNRLQRLVPSGQRNRTNQADVTIASSVLLRAAVALSPPPSTAFSFQQQHPPLPCHVVRFLLQHLAEAAVALPRRGRRRLDHPPRLHSRPPSSARPPSPHAHEPAHRALGQRSSSLTVRLARTVPHVSALVRRLSRFLRRSRRSIHASV